MSREAAGVGEGMPAPAAPARPAAAGLAALGLVVVLLAGEIVGSGLPAFRSGAAVRSVALALLTAGVLLAAFAGPGRRPALGGRALGLLALPLAVPLLGLVALDRGGAAHVARHGATWLSLALLPWGLCWLWSARGEVERAWRWLAAAGAAVAVLVLVEAVGGRPPVGLFGRTGVAGPVLAALAAGAVAMPPLPGPVLRWVPAGLLGLGCLATGSRTGWIALAIGIGVALAVGLGSPGARRRARIAVAVGAAGLVVALGLVVDGALPFPGSRKTVEVRVGLHQASLRLVRARPLTGHGLGSFPAVALQERSLREAQLEPRRRARHAHLDYLHAAVEGGVGAGLALLAYVVLLFGLGARASRGLPAGGARRRCAAALAVLAALGVAALGDGVLIDPAPVLVLCLAVATLVFGFTRGARDGATWICTTTLVGGALAALGCGFVLAKDAMADRAVMRYREAIAAGVTAAEAEAAAQEHLVKGALAWRPDEPEALYRLGVSAASLGQGARARDTFRKALAADPAMTEARIDLAQVYALEGRRDDARSVLLEARRRDPTRYDVRRQLMELAMGPEPVPGEAQADMEVIEVLRLMNEAAAVAPDRFENEVDLARFKRRRATEPEMRKQAGAQLRRALARAPGSPDDPPAEILIESFRLAEAETAGLDIVKSAILLKALEKNPRPAARFRAEAERFLDVGQERRDRAREAAGGDPTRLDMRAADRAFGAAAIRLTALLHAGLLDPGQVLTIARADHALGNDRRALARFRSLLAWALPAFKEEGAETLAGPAALASLARQGDLLLEAASVAHGIDRDLAALYRTQGQLRIGVELLEKGRHADAARKFRSVLKADPDDADARYGLARALAATEPAIAAEELIEALRLRPGLRLRALDEADLAPLRERADVKERLGTP